MSEAMGRITAAMMTVARRISTKVTPRDRLWRSRFPLPIPLRLSNLPYPLSALPALPALPALQPLRRDKGNRNSVVEIEMVALGMAAVGLNRSERQTPIPCLHETIDRHETHQSERPALPIRPVFHGHAGQWSQNQKERRQQSQFDEVQSGQERRSLGFRLGEERDKTRQDGNRVRFASSCLNLIVIRPHRLARR